LPEADALQLKAEIEDAKVALNRSERLQDTTGGMTSSAGIFGCGIARTSQLLNIHITSRPGSVDQHCGMLNAQNWLA